MNKIQVLVESKCHDTRDESWSIIRPDGTAMLCISSADDDECVNLTHDQLRIFCHAMLRALDQVAVLDKAMKGMESGNG